MELGRYATVRHLILISAGTSSPSSSNAGWPNSSGVKRSTMVYHIVVV